MNRTYVIGDIHGCRKNLIELLEKISPHPDQDTLIFLGDYIDRGPDSKGVIDEILNLNKRMLNVITLMGNHEKAFIDYINGKNLNFYLAIGGMQTLKSYGIEPLDDPLTAIPSEHMYFLKNLLLYWQDEENIFVHAGLEPGIHVSQQHQDWLLWARGDFLSSDYDFGKRIIFGHTVFQQPFAEKNRIGIDTGVVFGGSLTCLVLPDMKFVSVKNKN